MALKTLSTTSRSEPILTETAVEALRATMRGPVLRPGDDGYEAARPIYNGMIDRYPQLMARCTNVADVITAVKFAREQAISVAIRGGGHNGPGLGTVDDGLVIDLSLMKGVRVNPADRTVRAEAGCTSGDVDHATHAFGLAVPSGIVASTGIAGLTLGGGHGYLTRKYGLTIDNLLAVDVVLADGRFLTASAEENDDLFWAIRGGGGNFGVVTSFLFQAHPVHTVYAGPIFWDVKHARQILHWYREFLPQAPLELSTTFGLKTVPATEPFPQEIWGKKICALISCYSGPLAQAEAALKPIRQELPEPLMDGMAEMPFPMLQSLFDPLLPAGLQWYWKGDFVKELPDEAIEAHLEHAATLPSELSLMHLYPIDGAVHQIGRDETAWSNRDATWSMVIAGIDPDPAKADDLAAWAKSYWDAIHPYALDGAYINFMMEEGQVRIRATYGDNYDRLAAIKHKYDPTNFFHINQNIKPSG